MSSQTPAKHFCKRDTQLINGRLIFVWYADGRIHAQDAENGELLWKADGFLHGIEDLRISGDGFRGFWPVCTLDLGLVTLDRRDCGEDGD